MSTTTNTTALRTAEEGWFAVTRHIGVQFQPENPPAFIAKAVKTVTDADNWATYIGTWGNHYLYVRRGDLAIVIEWEKDSAGRMRRSELTVQDLTIPKQAQDSGPLVQSINFTVKSADWALTAPVDEVLATLHKHIKKAQKNYDREVLVKWEREIVKAQETITQRTGQVEALKARMAK